MHIKLLTIGTAIYSSTKKAYEIFCNVLSKEIGDYNITVNSIALSLVENTGMANTINQDFLNKLQNGIPLNLKLKKADLIYCIDFFISEKAHFITGHTLYTSGV